MLADGRDPDENCACDWRLTGAAVLTGILSSRGTTHAPIRPSPVVLAPLRAQLLVRGSAADSRLLVLDACRSGVLTRGKGGGRRSRSTSRRRASWAARASPF